jgi:hypothetical protein
MQVDQILTLTEKLKDIERKQQQQQQQIPYALLHDSPFPNTFS